MKVSFMKTGARRYGVLVRRDRAAEFVMNPAPGYDDYLPHDLLHFVAEAEWKLDVPRDSPSRPAQSTWCLSTFFLR
jgi:hypothetical protein